MGAALDIVRLSRTGRPVEDVARVYFSVGARFGLERLRTAGASIPAETPWQKAAVAAVVDDLFNYQSTLASRVLTESERRQRPRRRDGSPPAPATSSASTRLMTDFRAAQTVDLAMRSTSRGRVAPGRRGLWRRRPMASNASPAKSNASTN